MFTRGSSLPARSAGSSAANRRTSRDTGRREWGAGFETARRPAPCLRLCDGGNAVVAQPTVARDEHEVIGDALGDEHAVEWIAVQQGQGGQLESVPIREGEFTKTLTRRELGDAVDARQLAD